jgi:hypothetical protein
MINIVYFAADRQRLACFCDWILATHWCCATVPHPQFVKTSCSASVSLMNYAINYKSSWLIVSDNTTTVRLRLIVLLYVCLSDNCQNGEPWSRCNIFSTATWSSIEEITHLLTWWVWPLLQPSIHLACSSWKAVLSTVRPSDSRENNRQIFIWLIDC